VEKEWKDQVQAWRNKAKETIARLADDYFAVEATAYVRDLQQLAPAMNTLARLVIQFDQAFYQEKLSRNLLDFADLEHLALQLLSEADEQGNRHPSPLAR